MRKSEKIYEDLQVKLFKRYFVKYTKTQGKSKCTSNNAMIKLTHIGDNKE